MTLVPMAVTSSMCRRRPAPPSALSRSRRTTGPEIDRRTDLTVAAVDPRTTSVQTPRARREAHRGNREQDDRPDLRLHEVEARGLTDTRTERPMDEGTLGTPLLGGLADAVPHLVWVATLDGIVREYSGRIAGYAA